MGGVASFASSDLEDYRNNYPRKREDPDAIENLRFYRNEIRAVPEPFTVLELHNERSKDYRWLERCHSFIQWMFPIQEPGLNPQAQVLMKHEIAVMRQDPVILERVWKSFQVMVQFYGMDVKAHFEELRSVADEALLAKIRGDANHKDDARLLQTAGKAASPWRAEGKTLFSFSRFADAEWQPKLYRNLNISGHNYLRITRILKFLGEMGMEDLKVGWLVWLANEVFATKLLPNCDSSLANYWSGTIYNNEDRAAYLAWIKTLQIESEKATTGKKRRERSASPTQKAKKSTEVVVDDDL